MGAHVAQNWHSVWLTGASSGIGLALAKKLISSSGTLAVSARSADKLDAFASTRDNAHAFPLDVTQQDAVSHQVAQIEKRNGPIDLAILNAAAWSLVDVENFDLKSIRTGVEVNYMGVMNCVQAVLPSMLARGEGHIAIVASTAGFRGLPRSAAYGPTKAALINLAETLEIELRPHGVSVSLICPGFVDTPATASNPFPMPGMITADQAAEEIIKGLKRKRFDISFPFAFVSVLKLLRMVPYGLYFWLIRKFVWKNPQASGTEKRAAGM